MRAQRELALQTTLGRVLMLAQGYGVPAVEQTLVPARTLGHQLSASAALVPVQQGLWMVTLVRADLRTARSLAEALFQRAHDQP